MSERQELIDMVRRLGVIAEPPGMQWPLGERAKWIAQTHGSVVDAVAEHFGVVFGDDGERIQDHGDHPDAVTN